MAQTFGVVVETSDDGLATVMAEKGSGCGGCSAVSQCHGGRAANTERTPALNRIGAMVGDRVTLTIASGTILSRLAVLYLVPVFGLLCGAFTGSIMFDNANQANDGYSVAFGLAGFVLGFALSVAVSRIWLAVRPVMPAITRITKANLVSATSRQPTGCSCSGK